MQKTSRFENLLAITPAILMAILLNTDIDISMLPKIDTILLIFGNFAIAYYISVQINKKHKNEDQLKENCFKELDYILDLISDFRDKVEEIDEDTYTATEDVIVRFDSILSLQIELLKKYSFIDTKLNEQLFKHYYALNRYITENTNTIHKDYKIALLRLEETIINIKSSILQ